MKIGQTVTIVSKDRQEQSAVIIAISGTGESGYKRLSLSWSDAGGKLHTAADVPNERDAKGGSFWREGAPREAQQAVEEEAAEAPKKAETGKK